MIVKKSELAHILRAACDATRDPEILVIGSQAILASFDETELPGGVTRSIEADIAFFDDPDEQKSDAVDGAIGELSIFHEAFGIYGQGVGISTASLPAGWQERLVAFKGEDAGASRAVCLEPHDLVVSKLVAGRPKDLGFAGDLLTAGLVDAGILLARAELLAEPGAVIQRVIDWIRRAPSR